MRNNMALLSSGGARLTRCLLRATITTTTPSIPSHGRIAASAPTSAYRAAIVTPQQQRTGPSQRRFYHSYERGQNPTFAEAESAILSAALAHVPQYGFSATALRRGAQEAGYLDASVSLLPRGVFDLVNYHLVTRRTALKESVQFPSEADVAAATGGRKKSLDVSDKVRALTLARLRANKDIIHVWQQALAIMAQPSYVSESVAELARLADEIWFLAGDTSVDSSWYTKRASLAAIYGAAEVFMTQDRSVDFADTERFLDARLEDAREMGSAVGNVGEWVEYTGSSLINVLRSKGLRI